MVLRCNASFSWCRRGVLPPSGSARMGICSSSEQIRRGEHSGGVGKAVRAVGPHSDRRRAARQKRGDPGSRTIDDLDPTHIKALPNSDPCGVVVHVNTPFSQAALAA